MMLALVLVLGLGLAAYLARDAVLGALPDTTRLLALVFPPEPPGAGLELGKLESERRSDDGVPVLVVRGEIANPSGGPRDLPPLKASLYGAEGNELHSWRFTATAEKSLAADSSVRFQTEVRDPPVEATDLKISFVAE